MVERGHKSAYQFRQGSSPLLISIPHAGLDLLPGMQHQLSARAQTLPDTDWYVGELYAWAETLGVAVLQANYCRYVVDLNRPADDANLYKTRTTGLFPEQTFAGELVWLENTQQTYTEPWILENIWQPYHQKIQVELQKIKQKHGYALLLDAHSIAAVLPGLFTGVLPDLNLGSFAGASATPGLINAAYAALESEHYTRVLDGCFKGGFITRFFGQPEQRIYALQLELAQTSYLQDSGLVPVMDEVKLALLQKTLQKLVRAMLAWPVTGTEK